MRGPRYRIGALLGVAAAIVAPGAVAQQSTPSPTPTAPARQPTPTPTRSPAFVTLPGAENFSLQPTRPPIAAVPRPTPTPTPTPTPRAAPTPVLRATSTPTPAPRAAASPARAAPQSTPTPTPTVTSSPVPATPTLPTLAPTPNATPTPNSTPTVVPVPVIVGPQRSSPWPWIALAMLATAAAGGIIWLLLRRRRRLAEEEEQAALAAPPRPVPPPAPRPAPAPAPVPPPQAELPLDPVSIEVRPIHMDLAEEGALLEFEMTLLNSSGATLEGLRVSLRLISTSPVQDAMIAVTHGGPQGPPAGPPVDVPPGAGGQIPARISLKREDFHVVTVGGRPMFVPMVLVDLRWRSGLTLKRQGLDFMIGTSGEGGKLGPIWLDRGPSRRTGLSASRYVPRAEPAKI